MNIVLDLDNTLFYNHVVDTVCALHTVARCKRHDLMDLPEPVRVKCYEGFNDKSMMCNLSPFQNALGIDSFLSMMGHNVYVVTARDESMENETKEMVYKYFPMVKDVILVGSYNKFDVYKELNVDVVVDDHYDHIKQAVSAGVKHVFMISNPVTTYNHKHKKDVELLGGHVIGNIAEFAGKYISVGWVN